VRTGVRRPGCPLCEGFGGELIARDDRLRVVLIDEPLHPGFLRVIWHDHVAEMGELSRAERDHVMAVVFETEAVLRTVLSPDKINLASLGNAVPHLHWHVIARWHDDAQFPASVWSVAADRDPQVGLARSRAVRERLSELRAYCRSRLLGLGLSEFR
jgi:diadenosine tetraphosphate (Ap4A) HIT family hydrolase